MSTYSRFWGKGGRRSKYGNVKHITAKGEKFDSTKEFERWGQLLALRKNKKITKLTRDRKKCTFDFILSGVKICSYIADATYWENGEFVVEDTKSDFTRKNRVYRIKCKLMKAFYGITIREV